MSTHPKFQDRRQTASPRQDYGREAGPHVSREDGGAQQGGAGLDHPSLSPSADDWLEANDPDYREQSKAWKDRPPKEEIAFDPQANEQIDAPLEIAAIKVRPLDDFDPQGYDDEGTNRQSSRRG